MSRIIFSQLAFYVSAFESGLKNFRFGQANPSGYVEKRALAFVSSSCFLVPQIFFQLFSLLAKSPPIPN
jgi:hypothetical protein